MPEKNKDIVIGAFTIIHKGYIEVIEKYPSAIIGVISDELVKELMGDHSDIRMVGDDIVQDVLKGLNRKVVLLRKDNIHNIKKEAKNIIVIEEPTTNAFVEKFFKKEKKHIVFEKGFLRKDPSAVFTKEYKSNSSSSYTKKDAVFMNTAYGQTKESGDWWRQIGAVIVKKGKIIVSAHNEMMPRQDECYHEGDIRDTVKPGESPELCSSIHAEASAIAQAAKEGISLKDASIYVTCFPCPPCAKLIAKSGIKKVYFDQGWSHFDGERVLKEAGVTMIKTELKR